MPPGNAGRDHRRRKIDFDFQLIDDRDSMIAAGMVSLSIELMIMITSPLAG